MYERKHKMPLKTPIAKMEIVKDRGVVLGREGERVVVYKIVEPIKVSYPKDW